MSLTSDEIRIILEALNPGGGYHKDPQVSKLQVKLSIMAEVARLAGR